MTEEQAKTKWCPMVKVGIDNNFNCVASDCMMWRWVSAGEYIDGDRLVQQWRTEGFCGIGGKNYD